MVGKKAVLCRAGLRSTLPDTTMIGKPAPELALNTLDGKPLPLSSLRGGNKMPSLAKLYGEIKDQGVVLLGVDEMSRRPSP